MKKFRISPGKCKIRLFRRADSTIITGYCRAAGQNRTITYDTMSTIHFEFRTCRDPPLSCPFISGTFTNSTAVYVSLGSDRGRDQDMSLRGVESSWRISLSVRVHYTRLLYNPIKRPSGHWSSALQKCCTKLINYCI